MFVCLFTPNLWLIVPSLSGLPSPYSHPFCIDLLSLCIEFRKTTNVSKLIVCISA